MISVVVRVKIVFSVSLRWGVVVMFVLVSNSLIVSVLMVCLIRCVLFCILFVVVLCLGGVFRNMVWLLGIWNSLNLSLFSIVLMVSGMMLLFIGYSVEKSNFSLSSELFMMYSFVELNCFVRWLEIELVMVMVNG